MTVFDTNRANLSTTPLNESINALLDAGALAAQEEEHKKQREYLGASSIGSECLRQVQYSWQCEITHPARRQMIFNRGHYFEEVAARDFAKAGFRMERGTPALKFTAVEGLFQGHGDGVFISGPPVLQYPCLWEHKCLGTKYFRQIELHGLDKSSPAYRDQVQLYMAYLDLADNPALYTITNADTCERLHFLIDFDATLAQAASDRAVLVIKATQAGELLDRIASNPTDWRCKMCSHKDRCWE